MKFDNQFKTKSQRHQRVRDEKTGEYRNELLDKEEDLLGVGHAYYRTYDTYEEASQGLSTASYRLFSYLAKRYSDGSPFQANQSSQRIISKELKCSTKSIERSIKTLCECRLIYNIETTAYALNPRHVFKGSLATRKDMLKNIVINYCSDC